MSNNAAPEVVNLTDMTVYATSMIESITPLLEIKNSWQADEEDLQNKACEIGLFYEKVIIELRGILSVVHGLLNDPPAYGDKLQAENTRYLRTVELWRRFGRAQSLGDEAAKLLDHLGEVAMEADEESGSMGLSEARLRAGRIVTELRALCVVAERLSGRCQPLKEEG